MNRNVLIVLAGGFVIAILVAMLVQASLGSKKKDTVEKKVEILVAMRDLKVGNELGEKDVKWQAWPETMLFDGAIIKTGDTLAHKALEGRLKERVASGQPLHKKVMVDANKGNMLSASLREGYRAVGIKVPVETIAGGLIGPGDYVDVVMTYSLSRTGNSTVARKYASETILENIRVLGIDTKSVAQDLSDDGKKKKGKSKLTVTLEVTPEGAEQISLANEMGDIALALRSLGDSGAVAGDNRTTDIGMSKVLTEMSGGGSSGVRIYHGNQVQQAVVPLSMSDDGSDAEMEAGSDLDDVGDLIGPEDMMNAVREGISEGISSSIMQDDAE